MSATGRGSKRSEADYYPTPAWCVHRLLERVPLRCGQWLEPAVGDGAIVRAVNSVRRDVAWSTMDIRNVPAANVVGDFLSPSQHIERHDVIITNPPFGLALSFVQRALKCGPVVAMLLRINWLASTERASFMKTNTPSIAVLPNRPSFVKGRTDSCEYAWFLWGVFDEPRVIVLDVTPKAERRVQVAA